MGRAGSAIGLLLARYNVLPRSLLQRSRLEVGREGDAYKGVFRSVGSTVAADAQTRHETTAAPLYT